MTKADKPNRSGPRSRDRARRSSITSTVSGSGRPLMKNTSAWCAASAQGPRGFAAEVNRGQLLGHWPDERGLTAQGADVDLLTRPQVEYGFEPLARVRVAVVVVDRVEAQCLQLRQNQPLTTLTDNRPQEISAMLPAILANTSGLISSGLIAPMSSMRVVASASAASVDQVSRTASSMLLG